MIPTSRSPPMPYRKCQAGRLRREAGIHDAIGDLSEQREMMVTESIAMPMRALISERSWMIRPGW